MSGRRSEPQVNQGLRSFEHTGKSLVQAVLPDKDGEFVDPSLRAKVAELTRPMAPAVDKEKMTVFRSVKRAYRLQITSPADTWDPATGKKTTARPIFAQFRDHELSLTHDKEFNRRLIKAMKRSRGFGTDFFDASDVAKQAEEANFNALVSMIQAAPAERGLRARLLKTLQGSPDEFPVAPPAGGPAPSTVRSRNENPADLPGGPVEEEDPAAELEDDAIKDAKEATEGL